MSCDLQRVAVTRMIGLFFKTGVFILKLDPNHWTNPAPYRSRSFYLCFCVVVLVYFLQFLFKGHGCIIFFAIYMLILLKSFQCIKI